MSLFYEKIRFLKTVIVFAAVVLFGTTEKIDACTRVVYKGPNNTILTARSMDFSIAIPANLWLFPRGMERNGSTGWVNIDTFTLPFRVVVV